MTIRDYLALFALATAYLLASGTEPRPTPQDELLITTNPYQISSSDLRQGREGLIAHTGSTTEYAAIPLGPGIRIRVCAVRCLDVTSTDAGPSHDSLVAGRIMDLDVTRFSFVCDCPASQGLVRGSWTRVDSPRLTLPPTDTP